MRPTCIFCMWDSRTRCIYTRITCNQNECALPNYHFWNVENVKMYMKKETKRDLDALPSQQLICKPCDIVWMWRFGECMFYAETILLIKHSVDYSQWYYQCVYSSETRWVFVACECLASANAMTISTLMKLYELNAFLVTISLHLSPTFSMFCARFLCRYLEVSSYFWNSYNQEFTMQSAYYTKCRLKKCFAVELLNEDIIRIPVSSSGIFISF